MYSTVESMQSGKESRRMQRSAKRRRVSSGEKVDAGDADDGKQCIICLNEHAIDPTLLPECRHSNYCFACIVAWATLSPPSRRDGSTAAVASCPLCKTAIGPFVLHQMRGKHDASRHYLRPRSQHHSPPSASRNESSRHRHARSRDDQDDTLQQERTLTFRRRLYDCLVFSKHVASNQFSRWKSLPPPASFRPQQSSSASTSTASSLPTVGVSNWSPAVIQSRALAFLRRELLLFPHLHTLDARPLARPRHSQERPPPTPSLSFVTAYIFALLQALDLRSDMMTRLLAEFLCNEPETEDRRAAELFAHELACWLRSPYRRLEDWDRSPWLQYDFAGVRHARATHGPGRAKESVRDRLPPRIQPSSSSVAETSLPTQPIHQDEDQDREQGQEHSAAPETTSTPTAPQRMEVRSLRAHLLSRLEAEREIAQSHLRSRLAEEGLNTSASRDERENSTPEEHHANRPISADESEISVDIEKEARLRDVLRARMAARRKEAAYAHEDDALLTEDQDDLVPNDLPSEETVALDREAALRRMLLKRRAKPAAA